MVITILMGVVMALVTIWLFVRALRKNIQLPDGRLRALIPLSWPLLSLTGTLAIFWWRPVFDGLIGGLFTILLMLAIMGVVVHRRVPFWGAMVAVLVAVVLLFGGAAAGPATAIAHSWVGTDSTSASLPNSREAAEHKTSVEAPAGLDQNKLANAFANEFKKLGFKPGEVTAGEVDWAKNPVDNRGGAFGGRIESQQELTKFLNGDSKASRAARQHVLSALPKAEHQRALNGANYVPVQYLVDTAYSGNTYVTSNGTVKRGGDKSAKAGDVVWVFVTRDYKVDWDASVRADCSNPGYAKPPTPKPVTHKAAPEKPGKGQGETPKPTPSKPPTPSETPSQPPSNPPSTPPSTPPTTPPTEEPKCEVPGKEHLPPGHPDCKEDEEPCEYNPDLPKDHPDCKPPEVCPHNPDLPKDHPDCKPPVEVCPWNPELPKDSPDCLKPKDPKDDPTPPDGVTPLPQDDPVESEPPAPPATPIDPDEQPGDSIPDTNPDDGHPDTSVPDDEGHQPPADPPADDGGTDTNPTPEEPADGHIGDPDAAAVGLGGLVPLLLLVLALRRQRLLQKQQ